MGELYDEAIHRVSLLEQAGYKVRTIWEHDWDHFVVSSAEVQQLIGQVPLTEKLQPRDAFYGGRTEAVRSLYETTSEDEGAKYLDFMSLYPHCNKYTSYPVGYPENILGHEISNDISQYYGLVKARVLPPQNLLFPVLPCRLEGTVFFQLCRTCVIAKSTQCDHSEKERMLTGTWVISEMLKAREMGYKIDNMMEVWHWSNKSSELFRPYVDAFLKSKMEASGWPHECTDEMKKRDYIQGVLDHEGILLNSSHIEFNAGKRFVAKLCLNSFWGKFAQQVLMTKSSIVSEAKDLFELITSEKEDVNDVIFLNEELVEVRHTPKEEFAQPLLTSNVIIAAFTTASARLKLYGVLEEVGDRALYMDTDSVIYISQKDSAEPEEGNFLGDLKNELKVDEQIITFMSAGAKNYGYKTNKGGVEIKVRGFTLNKKAQADLNFDTMGEVIKYNNNKVIEVNMGSTIRKDIKHKSLHTVEYKKNYRMVFDERILLDDHKSVPYGYITY